MIDTSAPTACFSVKENMVDHVIVGGVFALVWLLAYRLVTLSLTIGCVSAVTSLAALLLFALSDLKHQYGLAKSDVVNIAMVLAVSS